MKLSKANQRIELAFNVVALLAAVKSLLGIGEKKKEKSDESDGTSGW